MVVAVSQEPRTIAVRDILLTADVRRLCGGCSRSTLLRWREARGFPEPVRAIRVGRGRKAQVVELWDRREVRQWLRDHPPFTREIVPGRE
jgi:class 3 adenylate cyclase